MRTAHLNPRLLILPPLIDNIGRRERTNSPGRPRTGKLSIHLLPSRDQPALEEGPSERIHVSKFYCLWNRHGQGHALSISHMPPVTAMGGGSAAPAICDAHAIRPAAPSMARNLRARALPPGDGVREPITSAAGASSQPIEQESGPARLLAPIHCCCCCPWWSMAPAGALAPW